LSETATPFFVNKFQAGGKSIMTYSYDFSSLSIFLENHMNNSNSLFGFIDNKSVKLSRLLTEGIKEMKSFIAVSSSVIDGLLNISDILRLFLKLTFSLSKVPVKLFVRPCQSIALFLSIL
jgi:hypothetical protein